mmetsp:Transcript_52126/g.148612  ORF Transcript_52126/g.148612 Transcript_52126/m.148612 type:complete len:215 (+) Transcript_52126:173-817(+)
MALFWFFICSAAGHREYLELFPLRAASDALFSRARSLGGAQDSHLREGDALLPEPIDPCSAALAAVAFDPAARRANVLVGRKVLNHHVTYFELDLEDDVLVACAPPVGNPTRLRRPILAECPGRGRGVLPCREADPSLAPRPPMNLAAHRAEDGLRMALTLLVLRQRLRPRAVAEIGGRRVPARRQAHLALDLVQELEQRVRLDGVCTTHRVRK